MKIGDSKFACVSGSSERLPLRSIRFLCANFRRKHLDREGLQGIRLIPLFSIPFHSGTLFLTPHQAAAAAAAGARTLTYVRTITHRHTDNPKKKARPVSRFRLVSFVCWLSAGYPALRGRKSSDSA